MTDVLLIVFVIAALIIAGFALEKHSKKTRQELMDELNDEAILNDESITQPGPAPAPVIETPKVEAPAAAPEVKQMVESQEAPTPKPAKKRRRGRPAAKKD